MKLSMRGSSGLVYVTEVSDALRDQAEILLRLIASREPVADGDHACVRLDWGIAKLERRGDEIVVEEPNYRGDPRRFVPGLNFTCAVLRAHQRVHERLCVGAEPVHYDQFMLVYPGGMTAGRIAAIRQATEREKDTGWRVFDGARIDWAAEPEARYVYEVAGERPALMAVLSLPVGWAVRLEGETLMEAAPPTGTGERIAIRMAVQLCNDSSLGRESACIRAIGQVRV